MGRSEKNSGLVIIICLIICGFLAAFIIKRYISPMMDGTITDIPPGTVYTDKDVPDEIAALINDGVLRYASGKLSGDERDAYEKLLMGVLAHADRIDIKSCGLDLDELKKVYSCLRNDYPELFWISNNCDVYTTGNLITDCLPNYLYDLDSVKRMAVNITSLRDRLLDAMKNLDKYEKIMYVFDYIIDNTVYDNDSFNSFQSGDDDPELELSCNIYGTLFKGKALCEGYAKTFQYLVNSFGINSIYVTGVSKNQGHAWNYVFYGGDWYGMDITWCDPQGAGDKKSYAYCMVDYQTLAAGHTEDMPYDLPECKGGEYNYYIYNAYELSVFSTETLSEMFLRAYNQGSDFIEFHCASRAVYDDFLRAVETQEVFRCFDGIKENYGVEIEQLSYGLMEEVLSVRVEL